jgi:hypothetical protein
LLGAFVFIIVRPLVGAAVGDEVGARVGAGVTGAGVIGSGVIGAGVIGSGVIGAGVIGSGVIGAGVIGAGVVGASSASTAAIPRKKRVRREKEILMLLVLSKQRIYGEILEFCTNPWHIGKYMYVCIYFFIFQRRIASNSNFRVRLERKKSSSQEMQMVNYVGRRHTAHIPSINLE